MRAPAVGQMTARRSAARVVITGAADGAGKACALTFAELGAELILCDYNAAGLQDLARQTGGVARFCDIASESSVDIFAADLLASFAEIDILINAAGSAYLRSLGMMRVSRLLLPALRRGEGGKLIANVASSPGLAANSGLFSHAGSDAAFTRLSESIALQTRGSPIRTATIIRGRTASEWQHELSSEQAAAIFVALEQMEPAQIASRIATLACEHVPGLDCGRTAPRQSRRAAGA